MSGRRTIDNRPTLAVIGATGAVGTTLLQILSTREDIWGEVRLVSSPQSAGRKVPVRGVATAVRALAPECFDGVDIAIFCVPPELSREWAPIAAGRGAVVVDGSSAWRMDPGVPLIVPEINGSHVANRPAGIVASPCCTTMSMVVPLGALHHAFGLESLVIAACQAASGVGQSGIDALYDQVAKVAGHREIGTRAGDVRRIVGDDIAPFAAPLAFNVVPWAGTLEEGGWTSEELTLRAETRKILGLPDLPVSATCVRVPVVTVHSVTLHARFSSEIDVTEVRELLQGSPGVVLYDEPEHLEFPTPADVVGTDPTWVGRLRRSLDDPRALDLFVCGDNLRKGAALNLAQIAELLV